MQLVPITVLDESPESVENLETMVPLWSGSPAGLQTRPRFGVGLTPRGNGAARRRFFRFLAPRPTVAISDATFLQVEDWVE